MSDAQGAPDGLSPSVLESWLRERAPELVGVGPLHADLLHGGLSNLTYRIEGGAHPFVLRRPPLGHVLSTAHDMAREFRVLSALRKSAVPVPGTILYDDDADATAGVGTPFYLMDFVAGTVLSSPRANAAFSPRDLRELSFQLVDTLADLHTIEPASVGLDDFGHPDGFLERQLRRWGRQYDQSQSREVPELDELQSLLHLQLPLTVSSSLLHGDYRLDNAIVRVAADGTPTIAAILDWEMATIGDSFTDLGLLGLYWDIRYVEPRAAAVAGSAVDTDAGYPSFDELVDRYAGRLGTDIPDLSWYLAFAAYKLAVILEGIFYRFSAGLTVGPGFESIGGLVAPLARAGMRASQTGTIRTN